MVRCLMYDRVYDDILGLTGLESIILLHHIACHNGKPEYDTGGWKSLQSLAAIVTNGT